VSIGLIDALPFKVKLLKVPKRRVTQTLTPQEIRSLLDCASGRIYGILLVAVHTGFRSGEILHLQWRDVSWKEGSLQITNKDGIWSSKNHQERTVFVSEELLDWLRRYRKTVRFSGDQDWIFSTRNQTPMTTFNVCRAVRGVFERAGLYRRGTPTLHQIRHTVASTLLANGTDLETVRDWLGHSDISTTSVYLHTTDDRKRAAAVRLRKALR
jgi:integrase/recombinase XerD